jgi:type II secretory pathway predicted ATPase ExeA
MQFNPFSKEASGKRPFESEDFRQAAARLSHLCKIKGIALVTGAAGTGKTFAIKQFADSLNPSLYKVFYLPLSTVTVLEFYRALAFGLGIAPPYKKIDLFNQIQERMTNPMILLCNSRFLCAGFSAQGIKYSDFYPGN